MVNWRSTNAPREDAMTYPVARVDRHEPLNVLLVVLLALAGGLIYLLKS
jgi:hypothetical protein